MSSTADCRLKGRPMCMRMGKAFRYYFQHPWSRLLVAYLVTFFNFLIFAEDPISHSQTPANVIVVGNCFSFLANKYPGGGWSFLKVLLWLLAIITGLVVGKFLFHQRMFGRLLRLNMFRKDHGSWMVMLFSTILFLFIFSHIYNLCLLIGGNVSPYFINKYMGMKNGTFMKLAAVGTWMGDFVTAWMVTDMMLQDNLYPAWGRTARAFWRKGYNRVVLFWSVLITLTSVVVVVITTDWISWDKLNRGFIPSDEVSRAFLASFILVFDLLIVMQDWEFPQFMENLEINLPGLPTSHIHLRLPHFQKIFKEEYIICITGKWFNYGIIFLVLILDLNMWKNQIFYQPPEYGQYVGPGQKVYTVEDSESLKDLNRSTLSWEWRSTNINPLTNRTYAQDDLFLHSRFIGARLGVKCLAFIPSILAFILFAFFIWFFGRYQKSELIEDKQDNLYVKIKRKSPSEFSKDLNEPAENAHKAVTIKDEALTPTGAEVATATIHGATSTSSEDQDTFFKDSQSNSVLEAKPDAELMPPVGLPDPAANQLPDAHVQV
ncbi:transmembrane protein 117 isoform X2 [Scyliorhinus canicula]|uniref:transmembrane protein 117 isoform X2 n=1 Tax=Scyliorhinus canicula TaxID=7830 RepID=UPI0018F71DC1|nr:transmembrane protein 117 isoform X2 [Scyliorhinus canicula]